MSVTAAIETSILQALQPNGLRERARFLISPGFSAQQVFERLPAAVQAELCAGGDERSVADPIVARRKAVDLIYRTLNRLAETGQVARRKVAYGVELKSKGQRGVLVDVYHVRARTN